MTTRSLHVIGLTFLNIALCAVTLGWLKSIRGYAHEVSEWRP